MELMVTMWRSYAELSGSAGFHTMQRRSMKFSPKCPNSVSEATEASKTNFFNDSPTVRGPATPEAQPPEKEVACMTIHTYIHDSKRFAERVEPIVTSCPLVAVPQWQKLNSGDDAVFHHHVMQW